MAHVLMGILKHFLATNFVKPLDELSEKLLTMFFLHLKIGNGVIKPSDLDCLQESVEWLFRVDGGEIVGDFSTFIDVV